ncbi:unnamed protein product [Tenebrio molitor]|nr:unnamed protein product [Tenebrio molitor]
MNFFTLVYNIEGDSNQNRTSRGLRRKTSAQSIVSEGKDVYYSGGLCLCTTCVV